MRRILLRALGFAVLFAAIGLVRPPAASAIVPDVFEISAGIKAGAGLEIWTQPSGAKIAIPGAGRSFDIPFFDETRAGYNASIGMFLEMRFVKYIGLEVGLQITRHKILEDTDWTYTEVDNSSGTAVTRTFETSTDQELVFTSFHIPIILKGILPVGDSVRLSLGVGPEFAIGSYAYANFKKSEPLMGSRAKFQDLNARSVTDTFLALQLGIDIRAGDFRVPIDLRWAYNFSQPDGYYDRIEYTREDGTTEWLPSGDPNDHPSFGTINARSSMYLQLLVGVAFDY